MRAPLLALSFASLLAACPASAQEVEELVFSEEDVTVPPIVRSRIADYVETAADKQAGVLDSLQAALNNFETAMSFASFREGSPRVLNAMASSLIREIFSEVLDEVPGVSVFTSAAEEAATELERAAAAQESFQVGEWIRTQRSAIDRLRRQVGSRGRRQEAIDELELQYLSRRGERRDEFFLAIDRAGREMASDEGPNIDELEIGLYERWIIAHYGASGYTVRGVVEFVTRVDDAARALAPVSLLAVTPQGDHAESALNGLFARGQATARKPFDLKVIKRFCVFGPGISNGTARDCGYLDDRGRVVQAPLTPTGQRAIELRDWRGARAFFGRE